MKVEIPQIYWHGDRESIMSIDFLPLTNFFVTCGYDNEETMFIRFWQLERTDDLRKEGNTKLNDKDDPNSQLEWTPVFKYGDKSQSRPPNVVKFSPMGTYMASAGCEDVANIWDYKRRYIEMGKTEMELRWGIFKVLRGHFSEISDLCWSRDEKYLVTASIDNTAILWNIEKGENIQRFEGHKNYVSGVTIDPFMNYIITQSTDKTVKVYKRNMDSKNSIKFYLKNNIYKRRCLLDENDKLVVMSKEEEDAILDDPVLINEKKLTSFSHRMFLDDSEVFSFSRRPEFSPDGSFFIVPCGVYQTSPKEKDAYYVSYGFTRNNVSEPAFILPSAGSCPLFVRFSPILYERKEEDQPFIDLPYIIVFAVATQDQILIYSTKSLYPFAVIGNIHYAELTDLTWNKDKLLGSSRDGFVTLISFDETEFGMPLTKDLLPDNISHLFGYLDLLNKPRDEKMMEVDIPKVVEFTYKSKKLQVTQQ